VADTGTGIPEVAKIIFLNQLLAPLPIMFSDGFLR
jgi:hypothetical protein